MLKDIDFALTNFKHGGYEKSAGQLGKAGEPALYSFWGHERSPNKYAVFLASLAFSLCRESS